MKENGLSQNLQEFIIGRFDSIEAIEIILLMRNQPSKLWTVRELNHALQSNPDSLGQRLNKLVEKGLAEAQLGPPMAYRYAGEIRGLEPLMTELAQAYIVRRFSIINLLYSGELENIKEFANAFVIRRKSQNG